jgi:chromosome segregation ATPase
MYARWISEQQIGIGKETGDPSQSPESPKKTREENIMSIRTEINQKEKEVDSKAQEVALLKEQLMAVEIEISNLEKELDVQRLLHNEIEESWENLSREWSRLDDELTDLKEATSEVPV